MGRGANERFHSQVLFDRFEEQLDLPAPETPEGNLVAGMRWLESTFGNRFNRFTGEQGPVFQGRSKPPCLQKANCGRS